MRRTSGAVAAETKRSFLRLLIPLGRLEKLGFWPDQSIRAVFAAVDHVGFTGLGVTEHEEVVLEEFHLLDGFFGIHGQVLERLGAHHRPGGFGAVHDQRGLLGLLRRQHPEVDRVAPALLDLAVLEAPDLLAHLLDRHVDGVVPVVIAHLGPKDAARHVERELGDPLLAAGAMPDRA